VNKRQEYYQKNKTKIKARVRAHYKANRERILAQSRKYAKKHRMERNLISKAYCKRHPDRRLASCKKYTKTHTVKRTADQRVYRKKYTLKYKAHRKTKEIRDSSKHLFCIVCKKLKLKTGNKRIEAHHYNYHKPLNVMWLCSTHHKGWHRVFKAEGRGK
jgi:hypothetical protein